MGDETSNEQWHDGGDVTLEQAIDNGTILKPSRLTWRDWQKWRKNPFGGRRATKTGGSTRPTTTQEESKLWQSTMVRLYGGDWLANLHGEEEEPVQEDKEEGPQVASSTNDGFPPGLEQVASSTKVPGPTLSIPKTPPAFKRTLSPLRAAKTTPSSSVGTGRDLPQSASVRKLEASPVQKLKDLKAGFPSTHRGLGFLDASKEAAWKAVPAFPKGESPNTQGNTLGRRVSEPSLPLRPEQDEESGEDPSPMVKTRMICRCCGQNNGPDVDACIHCGEQMYEIEGDEWEEDWDGEEVDWNEGDTWCNDNEGADGDSTYTGYTADSMKMPLEQARMEFQDDWDPSHETKDDFETRIQRAARTLEAGTVKWESRGGLKKSCVDMGRSFRLSRGLLALTWAEASGK